MAKLANVLCFLSVAAVTWLGCVAGMWSWTGFIPMGAALISLLVPLVPAVWLATLVNRCRRSKGRAQIGLFAILLVMVAPTVPFFVLLVGPLFRTHSLELHAEIDPVYMGGDTATWMSPGTAVAWIGDESEIPDGWLVADGRTLAKSDYESLFAYFGSAYGGGEDTFNLPDYRGMNLSTVSRSEHSGFIYGLVAVGAIAEEFGMTEIHWLIHPGD